MGPSSTGVTGLLGYIKLCEMYVTVTISTSMTHRALDNIRHDHSIEFVLRPVFRTLLSNEFVETIRLTAWLKSLLVDQHQALSFPCSA